MPRGRLPGTKLSASHKEALARALTGNTPWNKGTKKPKVSTKLSEEEKRISNCHRAAKSAATRRDRTIQRYIASAPAEWAKVTFTGIDKDRISATHVPCGNVIMVQAQTIRKWSWGTGLCRTCVPIFRGTSQAETELADFCSSLGTISRNVRWEGLELDIIFPDLKLAIEYDGLYWHSANAGYPASRHLDKTLMLERAGWRLIHIFEDEWQHQRSIVISRLRSLTGQISRRLPARKCSVVEVAAAEASAFLQEHHLQGAGTSKVRLGLKYGSELVALTTFGKPRFRKDHEWELLRLCSAQDTMVVGGTGKLLHAFSAGYPGRILSYADRRWSSGGVYERLGFKLLGSSTPSYFYFKGDLRINRQTFQKAKLKDLPSYSPELTEAEIMHAEGWNRIHDCGTLIFSKA